MRPSLSVTRHAPRDIRHLTVDFARMARMLRLRLGSRTFWHVQAMVAAIASVHYLMEMPGEQRPFLHLHHLLPTLFVFPIIYGSLRAGREGGLYTGLWCALLTLPNAVLWHQGSWEWLVEFGQIGAAVVVGLVLSGRVEQEATARSRAEEMTARVELLNRLIIDAHEDERLRIARDLHDETVQSLVLLCQSLDGLAATPGLPHTALASVAKIRTAADTTLDRVRLFSRDLRPSALDDLGLVPALERLVDDFAERSDVDAGLKVTGRQRRLAPETELALFRIVQEALRNVEKHAEASCVTVAVTFDSERAHLRVRDNGKGFDTSPSTGDLVAAGKLGLTGMQERARLVGAELDVRSQPGTGTCVTAVLDPQS